MGGKLSWSEGAHSAGKVDSRGNLDPMSEVKRPRVLVVFGGRSSEHLVSCATAAGVLHALDRERFDVLAVGITRDGQWVRVDDNPELVDLRTASDTTIVPGLSRVSLLPGLARLVETTYDRSPEDHNAQIVGVEDLGVIDVVLPLLHGPYGEDGTIQGLFEMSDVRYVGCGVTSSSASMDKHLTKTVLAEAGISVGRWELVTEKQWSKDPQDVRSRIDALGYPVFVKPTRAGSSVGISRVDSPDQLDLAIKEAAANDPRIIVEAMAHGREIECGVRVPAGGEAISLMCPADIPAEDAQRIQSIALKAFEALECEGLARVDFFYNDSTHEIIVNEVNTMPGFTRLSLYPRVWAEAGMSYTELVTSLLEEALSRPLGLR